MKKIIYSIIAGLFSWVAVPGAYSQIPVTGITTDKDTYTPKFGAGVAVTVTVLPADATNKNFTAVSSDITIAEYSGGKIFGRGGGEATITFITEDGGFEHTVAVAVSKSVPQLTALTMNRSEVSITIDYDYQLSVTPTPVGAFKTVTWESENESIATVDTNGKVTAVAEGVTNIIATSTVDPTISARCAVTVTLPVDVSGVTIFPQDGSATLGKKVAFSAVVTPGNATDQSLTWSSSDNEIAIVDDRGVVSTLAEGVVTITATSNSNQAQKGMATLTIRKTADNASIDIPQEMNVGDKMNLSLLNARSRIKSVAWTLDGVALTTDEITIRDYQQKLRCEIIYDDDQREVIVKYIGKANVETE